MTDHQGTEPTLDFDYLVNRGFESPDLDYKDAGSWSAWQRPEKAEFVRDLAGMANSDRPGWIVVGVAETDARTYQASGVSEEQAAGFDPTPIGEWVTNYFEPPIRFRLHKPRVNGKLFVVTQVHPFQTVPHICIKSYDTVLHQAAIYVRSEACQTVKVQSADKMRALVERATTNSADALVARIDELLRRASQNTAIGTAATATRAAFDQQIQEIRRLPGGAR